MNKWNDIYKNEKEAYQYYDIFEAHESIDKVILEIKRKKKNAKVLDLGCGAGRNTIPLIEAGFDVYAFDSAPEGIKILKKKLDEKNNKIDLRVLDFTKKLSYESDFFDAIISVQVLQHSYEKDIINSIKEIKRILKKEGIIFITVCGRYDSEGKERYTLVKTANKVANNTYIPTIGSEIGMPHFIYNKRLIRKHFKDFNIYDLWKDKKNYYCFLGCKK